MSNDPRTDEMGVIVQEEAASYSPIPVGTIDRAAWKVTVEFSGLDDLWAVRNGGRCLNAIGEWDQEPIPSSRTDQWLATHRFTRHQAANLAAKACHTVTWNGRTADEIAAKHLAAALSPVSREDRPEHCAGCHRPLPHTNPETAACLSREDQQR